MILIADGGSTKTDWRIPDGNAVHSFQTKGVNPYFNTEDQICESLSNSDFARFHQKIRAIHFYGAGLTHDNVKNVLIRSFKEIFPSATEISVNSDLLAAGRALFGNDPGIACILGTGSNSGIYKNNEIADKIPALGYILGDEGSGARMGTDFLNALFKRQFPAALEKEILENENITMEDSLEKVYKKDFPNMYLASITQILIKYIHHEPVREIIKNSLEAYFQKNIEKYKDYKSYELGFAGSIAFYFREILEELISEKGMKCRKIIKAPIDELTKYHIKNTNEFR